ncbi:hypothetical protein GOP47_0011077 [Adiantum capillus-veneris]|uniref:TCP domain-containing protein n=1 Tax=Adiantum capillus-veneris TaxID=13818 RepID=A0A9D4USI1_ADICA|nr:hypothetical protein GOP47_0011077 [Adiantum capillus-veneris]
MYVYKKSLDVHIQDKLQFFDVRISDKLGCDRPSKAMDWLIKNARVAIDEAPTKGVMVRDEISNKLMHEQKMGKAMTWLIKNAKVSIDEAPIKGVMVGDEIAHKHMHDQKMDHDLHMPFVKLFDGCIAPLTFPQCLRIRSILPSPHHGIIHDSRQLIELRDMGGLQKL